ncbi:AraC family transcriptional regulator [Bradyrhizobium sp. U87765 SZCCT0131]|uniref:AraC family transcriptional regulator n=1 Tax=unclassified Bradyrhizobium TaxID=2631580 RepID=UPI001BA7C7BF|nr:AraC family transcriptional regulator [Bradyrhizobium sp. U87765 SZCCT0131]MBR1307636.1 AraC family transcriptional regulator [Bradyrhizobium sp. U87765 SZCCT0110]MBR1321590.1 AraC family transcriptional regulator [Bradyrhizobium sp. U87765 SZCCT0109]
MPKPRPSALYQACTHDVGKSVRADYWVDACRKVWGAIDLIHRGSEDFYGALRSVTVGSSQLTWASLGGMTLERPRQTEAPFYSVAYSIRGRSLIVNDGREIELQPNRILLIDSTRPTIFRTGNRTRSQVDDRHEKFSIQLPAAMIADRLGSGRSPPQFYLPRDSIGASILQQFANALYQDGPALESQSASFLERQLCDLTAFCFAAPTGVYSEDSTLLNAHRHRISRWIAKHYANEHLSPQAIAAACGISVSYLHKSYRGTSQSVMEHVRAIRLDEADARLRNGATGTTISEIAYAVGFKSLSEFSRAYKLRFGHPPSHGRG